MSLGGAGRADEESPGDDCLLQPAVAHYMVDVQDRILDHWELPQDSMANRTVVVVMTFRAQGTVQRVRILEANDTRLKHSVAAAILRATPFDPVPRGAECLVGRPIRTTFTNPAD